jgi:hypothetical protein
LPIKISIVSDLAAVHHLLELDGEGHQTRDPRNARLCSANSWSSMESTTWRCGSVNVPRRYMTISEARMVFLRSTGVQKHLSLAEFGVQLPHVVLGQAHEELAHFEDGGDLLAGGQPPLNFDEELPRAKARAT